MRDRFLIPSFAPLIAVLITGVRPGHAAPVDFARDVRPIFQAHCHKCHGPDKREGGLRLDRKSTALAGGDHGPALLAGKSGDSRLIQYVVGLDEKGTVMPPPSAGERLTDEQVKTLRAWVDEGLAWPDGIDALPASRPAPMHWSFKPLVRPALPSVTHARWVRNPIDSFILARLEHDNIEPAPQADRITLIRRLHLDLLGLPPKPSDVEAFVNDVNSDAYEKLVDRLLASKHFGERWGRHWLDLARYADSDGYENDNIRPHAYRFRDWVIDAINRDLPFDQFTIEQLAGDLLPNATLEQKVATGFHRNTLHNSVAGADPEEFRTKAVKDRVNTTGSVWLGLTVGCAQCHTHKYDPLTQREYYGLFAFFNESKHADVEHPQGGKTLTLAAEPRETFLHVRGDFLNPGPKIEAGTPEFLPPLTARGGAGAKPDRLDLARWLVSKDNPLTARVAVNQIWQHLLGQPLVTTPDNFGINGEKPSHPDLLDWLAAEFMSPSDVGGVSWSRKRMIRLIVTSATYRQSSRYRPELVERDPANTLLARQNRFRVDAEVVRDLPLAVAGVLDPRVGGPSVQPPLPTALASLSELKNEKFVEASTGADRYRRGVYVHAQRTFAYPTLQAFDVTDGNETCARRDRSNTPMQALTLMNDPVFFEAAQSLAKRIVKESPSADLNSRLRHGWQLCVGRLPTSEELAEANALLAHHVEIYSKDAASAKQIAGDGADDNVAEAAAWTGVARMLLNLEEFYARE